jgi:hypothetical protein
MDEAQKTENESFFPFLVPDHTDLIKIVRNYLLEGTDSNRRIRVDLHEFNVNSMRPIHSHLTETKLLHR